VNDILLLLAFSLVGFSAGVVSGLLGLGGGVIFVPSLLFLLPYLNIEEPVIFYVLATSLFGGTFSASSSFLHHFKMGNVNIKAGLLLSMGSIPFAIIVPQFTVKMDVEFIKYFVGIVLLAVSIKYFFENESSAKYKLKLKEKWMLLFGAVTGSFSGMTGLGGGVLFVPILANLFSMPFKKSVGTTAIAVTFTMLSSAVSFAFAKQNFTLDGFNLGYINLFAGVPLGLFAILGARVGTAIHFKFSTVVLKKIFSLFLMVIILRLLFF
jgi:uncharacterized membrane protein YfcA